MTRPNTWIRDLEAAWNHLRRSGHAFGTDIAIRVTRLVPISLFGSHVWYRYRYSGHAFGTDIAIRVTRLVPISLFGSHVWCRYRYSGHTFGTDIAIRVTRLVPISLFGSHVWCRYRYSGHTFGADIAIRVTRLVPISLLDGSTYNSPSVGTTFFTTASNKNTKLTKTDCFQSQDYRTHDLLVCRFSQLLG